MNIPYFYQEIEQLYAKTVGKGIRTLAIVSSISEEGTSSVASALAQRAMAVNKRVLVVDLNLHNPFMTQQISVQTESNFNQPQLVKPDTGPCFEVMPAPQTGNELMQLKEQTNLAHSVEHWLDNHDLVIFDTSPICQINRNNIPAQLVASCSEAAIMVIQAGKTEQSQLNQALATLDSLNVNLIGTVVNDYTNPSLGVELIRQCCKLSKYLPKLADWFIEKINSNKFLFAKF